MKPVLSLMLLLTCCCYLFSCEKDQTQSPALPLERAMIGNWQVVHHTFKQSNFSFEDERQGIVTQWGGYYIHSLSINSDGTFFLNDSDFVPQANGELHPIGGKWLLSGEELMFTFSNNSHASFRASVTMNGKLILENSQLELQHHKKE